MRPSLLRIAERARAFASNLTQIRTNQVTIRTRTWSGAKVRYGTSSDSDLVLPARYPVRDVSTMNTFTSGGFYELEDLLVDHITPFDGGSVGYTPEQLHPVVTTDNVEVIYILSGPDAGHYSCVSLITTRPFTYQLVLRKYRAS